MRKQIIQLKSLFSVIALGATSCLMAQSGTVRLANDTTRGVRLMPVDSGRTDFISSIKVKGDARFFVDYRDMKSQYADQVTSSKNLAFLAYPNAAGGNAAGKPIAELAITAKPSSRSEVSIGYAFAHVFTGEQGDSSRFAQIRNLINFGGKVSTDYGLFSMEAGGGVLWSTLSPLTMSNSEYRPDNVDRLPWDWYTNSWQKYNDFYNASASLGGENYGAIGLQGFKIKGQGLPGGLGFKLMYGRTNQSVNQNNVGANPPSYVLAGRLSKDLGSHQIGGNFYKQDGFTDNINELRDLRQIITLDGKFDLEKVKIYTELGVGRVESPVYKTSDNGNKFGKALIFKANLSKDLLGLPISAQLYGISHDVVSNVSSSLNSNVNALNGGFGSDPNFSTALFINALTETGQITNNRMGLSIIGNKQINAFRIEFGLGLSQEIDNIYDTITFQHRSNAFSRSRFNPWVQNGGPYQRVKSIFRRTYEFLGITDEENGISTDYKKGFASADLSVNYKTRLLRKEVIFKLYQNVGSIQEGILPKFGDEAFLRQWYGQLITFVKLSNKVSALAFYEQEWNVGNERTNLSDHNGGALRQFGEGFGYGLDYDFASFAGLYFRHRFMYNQDLNFVKDNFEGQELTLELKVFF